MTCSIHSLAAAHLDAVLGIAKASPEAPIWRRTDYALFLADAPRANPNLLRAGFVAQISPAAVPILAFACATLLRDGQENRAELATLAVLPAARRQGIGATLLSAVVAWAAENYARHLSLEVRESNAAAVALYWRLGFLPEGRRRSYYADPVEDGLILGRPITHGSPP
ncbi:MAG TPA: GNAT family N-acetyltransferase [Acidobacteriaceae bacterium]|jgi:ribosomal protein S18 acetylase RimI-like enzyme|nr:GNAT family N-acetyltransferase [Acidobacteriaceae bacterium]